MRLSFLLLIFLTSLTGFAQLTPFEKSNSKASATYEETISYYKNLAAKFPKQAKLLTHGQTDFGKPLHVLVLSSNGVFDAASLRKSDKRILLINNGIHPGEPEGIDASMLLARDLLTKNQLPKNVVICIIPIYNIDGSFNRSGTSRANQNGPLLYGFRGNSRNYDLNRDFIKTDSKNSAAFQEIFNKWKPEVFVDTHTSNGSDYQYTMTLIPTQKDKLNPILSGYMTTTMLPYLYSEMKQKGVELIPYVNSINETPDNGITGFLETPRYSTGYAALHNSLSFMPETHMLKPYDQRVVATYKLLQTYINITERDAKIIGDNKRKADLATASQQKFPLAWKLNQEKFDEIVFKGYAAKYKPSGVSGIDRLYYDRNEPYTKKIKQWNNFEPALVVEKPIAYIIPKAWEKVIQLLRLNNVKLHQLKSDIKLELDIYFIENFKTTSTPYEGHYLHSAVNVKKQNLPIQYYADDYVVYVNQSANRYIVETLEPQATDSFFNWNFFDSTLARKEHFSAYIFEDTASDLLKENVSLKQKLIDKKTKDTTFAKSAAAQLNFIYQNSAYSEPTFMRYPIGRLETAIKLDLK